MSDRERAVVFGDPLQLVGVLASGSPALPSALLLNAGLLHRIGAQRMNVELARRLAVGGFGSLRFDLSGIGDSPPRPDRVAFREASITETRAAMDFVAQDAGQQRFVLFGLCSGADQAFQTAVVDDRVVGVCLLDPYPYQTPGFRRHRILRPLRRAETWRRAVRGEYGVALRVLRWAAGELGTPVDPGLAVRDVPPREDAEAGYRALLDRGVSVHVMFTAGQLGTYNHEGQFWEIFPSLRGRPGLSYTYLPQADHTLSVPAVRAVAFDDIERWFLRCFGGAAP